MSYEASARFYDLFDTKGNVDFYVGFARDVAGPVLELGVGTGRVAIEFARLGIEVHGIDSSPSMLAEAERKLASETDDVRRRCHFFEGDMREFSMEQSFDFIYSPSAGFNHATSADVLQCVQCASKHLAPSGLLAFDLMSPKLLRKDYSGPAGSRKLADGNVVSRHISQTYNKPSDTTSFVISYEITNGDGALVEGVSETAAVAVIACDQLTTMFELSGLIIDQIHGGFHSETLTDESDWIVVVARRG